MATQLHAVINRPGEFEGFSANYSGAGFNHMRFKLLGVSAGEFDSWLQKAKGVEGRADARRLRATSRSRASACRCAATAR
jgi:cytochrome o ubiquinol oxidase subunit 2